MSFSSSKLMEIMKIAKEPNIHDCEIEKKIKVCASQSLKNVPPPFLFFVPTNLPHPHQRIRTDAFPGTNILL